MPRRAFQKHDPSIVLSGLIPTKWLCRVTNDAVRLSLARPVGKSFAKSPRWMPWPRRGLNRLSGNGSTPAGSQ
jgi:hypothetical protein